MQREVSRDRKLAAFEFDIASFEVLLQRLVSLFEKDAEPPSWKLRISLKDEECEFNDVQELRDYRALPGRVTNFSISVRGRDKISDGKYIENKKAITIWSGGGVYSIGSVTTRGDTDAWCAGAVEEVVSFVNAHRLWYFWFATWPFGFLLVVLLFLPADVLMFGYNEVATNKWFVAAWILVAIVLAPLFFAKKKLLPASVLVISNEEGFFRRNAAQLSLLVAILAAILTVVGWFVGK